MWNKRNRNASACINSSIFYSQLCTICAARTERNRMIIDTMPSKCIGRLARESAQREGKSSVTQPILRTLKRTENNRAMDSSQKGSGSLRHTGTLVVSVEGNIGSGKSTFLAFCEPKGDFLTCPEPIDKWRDVRGENLNN